MAQFQHLGFTQFIAANTTSGNTQIVITRGGNVTLGQFNIVNTDLSNSVAVNFSYLSTTANTVVANATISGTGFVITPGQLYQLDLTQEYKAPSNVYVTAQTVQGIANIYITPVFLSPVKIKNI